MQPKSLKEKAVYYRKKGYSYKMISEKLGLSKSTLSYWLKEIPFAPNKYVLERIKLNQIRSGLRQHHQKVKSIRQIKKRAKKEIGKIAKRDLLMLGIGLYMGEGTKSQESIRIINSDPEIIKTAIVWFQEICGVPKENFRLSIHLYPDHNEKEVLKFWSKITGIPLSQFGKTQVDRRKKKGKGRIRKLPFGTAHLKVVAGQNKEFGVKLHRRIIGWIEEIFSQINERV